MTKDKAIAELVRIWHSPHLDLSLKAGLAEAIETLKEKNQSDSLVRDNSDACKESESKLDLIRRADAIEVLMETIAPPTLTLNTLVMRINSLPSAEAVHGCDGCDIFAMAEELAMASIDACADEIVRQIKDSRVECDDCKHHHTSEMYEYCDLIAVKGRRQRVMKYCSLGERR